MTGRVTCAAMVLSRIRVALDVTPLAGRRTGIGGFVSALASGLAAHPDVDLQGMALTARGRDEISAALPEGVQLGKPVPAALVRRLWRHVPLPPVSWLAGSVDIVHGTNYVVPPGGAAAALVSVHDLSAWRKPDQVHETSRVYPRLVDRALGRGAHVHADSHFVAGEIEAQLRVPKERLHVVHLAASPLPPANPAGWRDVAGDGAPYLLAVGTIEPRKDYPGLVTAFAEVKAELPELRLVIAGGSDRGTEALVRTIEGLGLSDSVIRPGYVTNQQKADLFAGARALVYPSTYEGFGIVPLEAMMAGVPVVATAAGSVPEICGEAAMLVPVRDPSALAKAIQAVTTDEARREALILAGKAQAARFSWDRTVEQMVGVYHQVINSG